MDVYEEKGQTAVGYTNTIEQDEKIRYDDEAAHVLSTYDGPATWNDEEERKLLRKIDWRLMPILCVTCTCPIPPSELSF